MNQDLIAVAKDNTIRVSSLKLSNIVRTIVNKKVSNAVNQLKFSQKRISKNVLKVLNAAVANAENNKQLNIDNLFVKEFGNEENFADEGYMSWKNIIDLKDFNIYQMSKNDYIKVFINGEWIGFTSEHRNLMNDFKKCY